MSVSPPASFEPFDGRNGVPGDASDVTALARRYANTAAEIESQAANLRRLTSQARGGWKGRAGEKFADAAGDLADRIGRAEQRYEAAARALDHFGDRLDDVQTRAYDAVRRGQGAQEEGRRLRAARPARAGASATPEEVLAASAELRAHEDAIDAVDTRLSKAGEDYRSAKDDYGRLASAAAAMLRDGRRGDDLTDSWWDRNAGWLRTALKVIGAVVLVLAIIALVIALFIPGLNVVVLGAAVSAVTALNVAGATLTSVMLAGHVGLWQSGNGEFSDVVWDLVGLATFGLGFAIAPAARALGGAASRIGQGIAATRGGRAAFSARGLPGRLFDVGRRVPLTRPLLSLSARMRGAFQAADEAAESARGGVATLTGRPTTMGSRVLAFADRDMAELTTLVSRIDDAVPGSIRVEALDTIAKGSAAVWGWGVQGGLLVQSGYSQVDAWVLEPRQEARNAQDREETVQQWSMPLLHGR